MRLAFCRPDFRRSGFRLLAFLTILLSTFSSASLCLAHEFWLQPTQFRIEPGSELQVDILNGQDYLGTKFPYLPNNYRRFYIQTATDRFSISSRLGDYPAVQQSISDPGLQMVVLESAQSSLGYDSIDDFTKFLDYHGLQNVEAIHRRRALPLENIRESYSRYAKTLIQSGPVDPDAEVSMQAGLLFELVPLQNPYAQSPSGQSLSALAKTLDVTLLFKGQRLSNAQVEIFHRSGSDVSRSIMSTGQNGIASLDITKPGDYLINSVQLVQPRRSAQNAEGRVHWESLWASLTFNVQQ